MSSILTEVFNEIDDGDGILTIEELIKIEGTLNKTVNEQQAQEIITAYDTNGDGKMNLEEFILYKRATIGQ